MKAILMVIFLLFLTGCQPGAMSSGHMEKDMRMMNDKMVHHLGGKDPQYEARFIDMMIPHHEGAILMAKNALNNSSRPEIQEMAQAIITSQEREIEQLKKWRSDWYSRSMSSH